MRAIDRGRLVGVSGVQQAGWFFVATLLALTNAQAASHFWLSASASSSPGPEAPSLGRTVGDTVTLYLWGRPDADRQFDGLSIDILPDEPFVDFVDGTFTFYNDVGGGIDRFEFTRDSGTTPPVVSTFPGADVLAFNEFDDLIGLRGFTLEDSTAFRGPGPHCVASEVGCEVAGDGEPAWLIASFDVAMVQPGSVDLYLQIGDRGVVERTLATGDYDLDGEVAAADHAVWAANYGAAGPLAEGVVDGVVDAADYTVWRDHLGETSTLLTASQTTVRFGIDPMGGDEPLYNASTDQETTDFGVGNPDATLSIAAPAAAAPEPSGVALLVLALPIRVGRRRPTAV